MPPRRLEPHGKLNFGVPVTPRDAATVVVVRGGAEMLEVLLLRRNPGARFMGGVWVFPGGAVDEGETIEEAAVREVAEEIAVDLPGPEALVPFSRWITPEQVAMRFDTYFFLARLPDGAEPVADGTELVDMRWYAPREAIQADIELVTPTIKTLEAIGRFETVDALFEGVTGREVRPVTPQVVFEGEVARVVLPGEPGFA